MKTLDELDVSWCVQRLPKEVRTLLEENPGKLSVAGGYIRSVIAHEEVQDIDLFSDTPDTAHRLAKSLTEGKQRRVHETCNADTVLGIKPTVQFIHRWTFDSPEKVVESFDFSICAAAIWCEKDVLGEPVWHSACHDRFYADLASKRLVYLNPIRDEEAGGSLLRVLKYYQRGYRIPLDSLASVLTRVLDKYEIEKEAGLIDRERIILGILREVDPLIGFPVALAAEAI